MDTKPLFRKVFRPSQCFGEKHSDTKPFNDFEEILAGDSESNFVKIVRLVVYFGNGISSKSGGGINGIRSYYRIQNSAKTHHKTKAHRGSHHFTGKQMIDFGSEEYIVGVTVRKEIIITKLVIETSYGKRYEFGADKGEVMNFNLSKENKVVVGFYGGFGGHLHNIGFYYANQDLFHKLNFQKVDLESLPDIGFSVRAPSAKDLKVTESIGRVHRDTILFDHVKELSSYFKNFCSSIIKSLTIYYGENAINGIQASYLNLNTMEVISCDDKFGQTGMKFNSSIQLQPGEHFTFIQLYYSDIITTLNIKTNKRSFTYGASKLDPNQKSQNIDLIEKKGKLIAFRGGFGGHLHSLGIYFVEHATHNYYRRSPYLMLYYMIKKNAKYKAELSEHIKKNAAFAKNVEYLFIRACLELDFKIVKIILKFL